MLVRFYEVNMADIECLRYFVQSDDCGVSVTSFKSAEILLADTGTRRDFFLRQAFFPTEAGKVPADQLAHIHARKIAVYIP